MPIRSPAQRPGPRRVAVLLAGLVAAAVTVVAAGAGIEGAAVNEPTAAVVPRPAPIQVAAPQRKLTSYLLTTRRTSAAQTRQLARAVERSDGTVVQTWPQIGVVVAHTRAVGFRAAVTDRAGPSLGAVGATRTVAVRGGTPAPSSRTSAAGVGFAAAGVAADVVADPDEDRQPDLVAIRADQAHQLTDGAPSVVVGVLDSGIDPDHPDLATNLDVADSVNCTDAGRPDTSPTGWQPTSSDHGTHVAGTIAAARNGVGIVGVAPGVRIASVKVADDDGFIYPEYAVCGFMWAGLRGLDVTNNSYYVDPWQFYCNDQPDQQAAREAISRAVRWSTRHGVVHAAAAGNASYDLARKRVDTASPNDSTPARRKVTDGCRILPGELPGVVTVSATDRAPSTRLAGLSNRGRDIIDVTAPGVDIFSTVVADNGYDVKSGTSMASAHVAGVLALMRSAHPELTPPQIIARLRAEADPLPCTRTTAGDRCVGTTGDNSFFGAGMVDALAAVR